MTKKRRKIVRLRDIDPWEVDDGYHLTRNDRDWLVVVGDVVELLLKPLPYVFIWGLIAIALLVAVVVIVEGASQWVSRLPSE